MFDFPSLMFFSSVFVSLFFEVFLLLTFLENRKKLGMKPPSSGALPTATIVIPCFNEEESVFGTVESLLALDYPKDKLKIMIIDDGSTDQTWNLIQRYQGHPNIILKKKENGGKHTALNLAISQSSSEIIGCLDADSFVSPNALRDIAAHFFDPQIMAVTPAIKIYRPDNVLRKIQKVEYDWGIFLRKMLSFVDALYVTPGPFSFFRRTVFQNLGPYKKAHNTEDMEMAMRLQKNNYRIENCHTALVYTIAPGRFSKLFTQRLRWTYGFLKNAIDYRELFFNRRQGHLGLFILPLMIVSAFFTLWLAGAFIVGLFIKLRLIFVNWQAVNFSFPALNQIHWSFSWFYFNTNIITLVTIVSLTLMVFFVLLGRRLSEGKIKLRPELLYFFLLYPFIAPTWLAKSVYNVIVSKKTVWR